MLNAMVSKPIVEPKRTNKFSILHNLNTSYWVVYSLLDR